jgi:quinate dehydrogenase (quinone)
MVHHDLWDYDNASQPSLYDFPDGRGGRNPAVIQMTKQGQIFVLDRRTGEPLTEVVERPVPRGNAKGERYSPTQPFSVGMPMIGAQVLAEVDMWGATPIDQMLCRIAFRKMRYDGLFTPPGDDPMLFWPGYYGGMNWGGATIDAARDYLIFNDIRVGQRLQLIPRDQAEGFVGGGAHSAYAPQAGTPYGVTKPNFMSPLGVPCQAPPYGALTAIDLRTREIAWQVPLGTVQDTGPLGIAMHLPLPIGMPTLGGPVSTAGGITFYAGTQDFYLRAMDSDTGEELWKGRLPVGANATPMIYVSPTSGKQFVVISAGGARDSAQTGDYIIVYKLPD